MKLYYYEHCPYCIRVLMMIGYKNLNVERIVLANDDEITPMKMIGKKMLPILEKDDGSYLPESLDIVDYLDQLSNPVLDNSSDLSTAAQACFDDIKPLYNKLILPRMPQAMFKEFETESARAYFTKKKEQMTGPFTACINQTQTLITEITPLINRLSELMEINENKLTKGDIQLFPWLYLLQLVDQLPLPEKIQHYLTIKYQQIDAAARLLTIKHKNKQRH